jgi:hypothetical protein
MTVSLSSLYGAGAQLFDNKGVVLSGGKIYTYAAGSLTPAVTWSDSLGTIANSNPIILDSAGRTTVQIYLLNSVGYKFIVTDSNGSSIGVPWDNIFSVGTGGGGGGSTNIWTESGLTPTYVSGTSFTVPGNQTALFITGTRVKTINTGGTAYSTVISSSFSSSTTITVANDSVALDSGLSDVATSFVVPLSITSSGSFTPTMKSGGVVQATNISLGRYLQIGNCVTVSILIRSTGAMSNSQPVTIGGLPIPPSSSGPEYMQNVAFVYGSQPPNATRYYSLTGGGLGNDLVLMYGIAGAPAVTDSAYIPASSSILAFAVTGTYFIS